MIKKFVQHLKRALTYVTVNRTKKIWLGDRQYTFPSSYANRFASRNWHEVWLDEMYRAALSVKEGSFIDVGVNTGQSLIKVLSFDRRRRYVGFEPQLDCCFFVGQFIRQNELSNFTLFPVGLSDHNGIVQLLKRREETDATASTITGFRPSDFYASQQEIYVVRGDDILPAMELQTISTVKIDVEGGEPEVVAGMQETLRQHRPFVFFEVLNHFLAVTGQELDAHTISFREERTSQLESMLRDLGFCIFNIRPGNKLIEVPQIQATVSHDLKITDYVAVHGDYRDRFLSEMGESTSNGQSP
jgi:FkbM family methyltransferase